MKQLVLVAMTFVFCSAGVTPALAQSVTLTTQTAVDNFDLTEVTGDLDIADDGSDPITNLDGLSGLTSVGGTLRTNFNTSLTNVDGLHNLTSVGFLSVFFSPLLTDVDGLSGLTTAGTIVISINPSLTDVDGLSGVTSVGNLLVTGNPSLTRFCGLFPLMEAGGPAGFFLIAGNANDPTAAQILASGPCDPFDIIQDLLDDGAITAGMAQGLLNLVNNSPEHLAGMLYGFVEVGILTVVEAQLLFVIANI